MQICVSCQRKANIVYIYIQYINVIYMFKEHIICILDIEIVLL